MSARVYFIKARSAFGGKGPLGPLLAVLQTRPVPLLVRRVTVRVLFRLLDREAVKHLGRGETRAHARRQLSEEGVPLAGLRSLGDLGVDRRKDAAVLRRAVRGGVDPRDEVPLQRLLLGEESALDHPLQDPLVLRQAVVEAADRLRDAEGRFLVVLANRLEDGDPVGGTLDRARKAPLHRLLHLGVRVQSVACGPGSRPRRPVRPARRLSGRPGGSASAGRGRCPWRTERPSLPSRRRPGRRRSRRCGVATASCPSRRRSCRCRPPAHRRAGRPGSPAARSRTTSALRRTDATVQRRPSFSPAAVCALTRWSTTS